MTAGCRCGGQEPFLYWDEESVGQGRPCRKPRKRMQVTEQLLGLTEIPDRYRWIFRGDFQERTPDGTPVPDAARISAALQRLVDDAEEPRRGLFLYGRRGRGRRSWRVSCSTSWSSGACGAVGS
ncbi:hypothetical protein ACFL6X_05905 [Candidatus Latescibacterota bacterium]